MDKISEEQLKMFKMINKHQAELKATNIAENDYKPQKANRNVLKNGIIIAGVIISIIIPAKVTIDKGINQIALNHARREMNIAIDSVAPDVSRFVMSDGKVALSENNETNFKKLCDELINEYGFSRDCAIYCISEKYGQEAFDKVTRAYGYANADAFLKEKYTKSLDVSSSGETSYGRVPSYEYFENRVQSEYIEKSKEIESIIEHKALESKGMNL